MVKLTRLADYIMPRLIFCYMSWAWWLCTFHIGVGWLWQMRNQRWMGGIYVALAATAAPTILWPYIWLLRSGNSDPEIPCDPPEDMQLKKVIFECSDLKGDIRRCNKGRCAKRWKPPRAHHCSNCDICRPGYDHHCPWIGTCVGANNKREFLLFLGATSILLGISVIPIAPQLIEHVQTAINVSQHDPWIRAQWWDWPGSWFVFGGPAGRYVTGVILGYRVLQRDDPMRVARSSELGSYILFPSALCASTAALNVLLCLFCMALAVRCTLDITRGELLVERLRRNHDHPSPVLVWVPCTSINPQVPGFASNAANQSSGRVVPIPRNVLPYSWGWRNNLEEFWTSRFEPKGVGRLNSGVVLEAIKALECEEQSPHS